MKTRAAHRLDLGVLALVVVMVVAGCASSPARLHFGVADAPEGRRLMWPAEPDPPRYLFAGQLVGEQNFVRDNAQEGALTQFFRWVTGLANASNPVVLQRPQAIVGDRQGRIYVTDTSRGAVFVFDPVAGELRLLEYAVGLRRFASPVGMVALPEGDLLVADAELALVAHVDPQGTTLAPIGQGVLQRPTGLALDRQRGELFVADTYAHDIKVFARDGRLLRRMGERGEGPGQFNFPSHLSVAGDSLYVTDTLNSRVQVLDLTGQKPPRVIGERGLFVGNLVRPKGIAVDGEGNIYVVESYHDRLLVFDAQGRFLMPIGGVGQSTGLFYLPAGVWVDEYDRVFVADTFNGRVTIFQFLGGNKVHEG